MRWNERYVPDGGGDAVAVFADMERRVWSLGRRFLAGSPSHGPGYFYREASGARVGGQFGVRFFAFSL